MTTPSLLLILTIPISRSPKDLLLAMARFTMSSTIVRIGILWRKFMSSFAVCQTTVVMFHPFGHDVPRIMNCVRQHFKVRRITAQSRLAKVVDFQSSWNWPNQQFVNMPMNIFPFSVNQDNSIASDSLSAGPQPAGGIRLNTGSFLNT